MDISNYIGVIIAIVVMLYVTFKQVRKVFSQSEEESQEATRRTTPSRKASHRIETRERVEQREARKPSVQEKPIEKRHDAYTIYYKPSTSRGRLLLDRLPSKREMVVLSEIIGPPRSNVL